MSRLALLSPLRRTHGGYFDPDSVAGAASALVRRGVRVVQTSLVNPVADRVFGPGHGDHFRLAASLAVRRAGHTLSALLVDGARVRAGWNPEVDGANFYGGDPTVYVEMLEESAFGVPRKVAELEKRFRAQGKEYAKPFALNVGAPGIPPSDIIRDAVNRAMLLPRFTGYCPPSGLPEARAAAAEHYSQVYGHSIDPAQVYFAPSAKSNIHLAVHALLNPGDLMVVQCPAFPMHLSEPLKQGVRVIPWLPRRLSDGSLKHYPEDLEYILRKAPTTKVVLVCNPSNPTGTRMYEAENQRLAQILKRGGQFVIMDSIYRQNVWGADPHHDLFHLIPDQTILLDGISKAWAWTGGRVGWAVSGSRRLARAMERNGIGEHSCVNPAGLVAAAVCLSDNEHIPGFHGKRSELEHDFIAPYTRTLEANVRWVMEYLRANLPECSFTPPEGAFYLFVDIEEILNLPGARQQGLDDESFTDYALERGVAFLAGRGFGPTPEGRRFIRLSYAGDLGRDIQPGLQRLKEIVDSLR